MKRKKEVITGKRLIVMKTLARFHNRELFAREFINHSDKVLKFTTIDKHLARLEADGLIESWIVNNNGHSGRLFALTKAGIYQLKKQGISVAPVHPRAHTVGL